MLALTVDPFYIAADATKAHVHYHVRDACGNERISQPLSVPVKLTLPGNPPEPPDGNDPSLNPGLTPPYNVPGIITDASTVCELSIGIAQYANQSVGDVISVYWADTVVQHGPLVADDLNSDILVTVPGSVIAAHPGTDLAVRYSIRDKVQNYSRYSPSVLTTVEARGSLPEPAVEGTLNGDLSSTTSQMGRSRCESIVTWTLVPPTISFCTGPDTPFTVPPRISVPRPSSKAATASSTSRCPRTSPRC